jgi:hypothetical protein
LILTLVASLVQIIGYAIYNVQTFKKMSEPNVASWLLWAVITVFNFTSYRSMSGDWMKSLLPTVSSFFCILTFIVAVIKGGRLSKLSKEDTAALVIGMIATFMWYFLKSATYANLIIQVAVIIGFIPTLRTAKAERPLAWFIWTSAYTLGVSVVILRWNNHWQDLVYPVMCVFAHLAVALISQHAKTKEQRIYN